MQLNDIHRGVKKHKRRLRVGRGPGSGRGKTAGRGHKGQGQLAGWTAHPAFEGGQMPLVRRVPKRGFHNQFADEIKSLNVGELDALFDSGAEVSIEALKALGKLQGRFDQFKVLGGGELTKKLKISAHRFSKSALEKISAAGGEAVVLPQKAPVVKNQKKAKSNA